MEKDGKLLLRFDILSGLQVAPDLQFMKKLAKGKPLHAKLTMKAHRMAYISLITHYLIARWCHHSPVISSSSHFCPVSMDVCRGCLSRWAEACVTAARAAPTPARKIAAFLCFSFRIWALGGCFLDLIGEVGVVVTMKNGSRVYVTNCDYSVTNYVTWLVTFSWFG